MKRRSFFSALGASAFLAGSFGLARSAKAETSSGQAEKRLKELAIILPRAPKAIAAYVPFRIVGNMLYVAGQGPIDSREHPAFGKVGKDLTEEQGYQAARTTAYNILAQVKKACDGDLDRVVQCVQIQGMVNCVDGFENSPRVINGASELLRDVFGERGLAARAAIGTNSLPMNIACEVLSIFEIKV